MFMTSISEGCADATDQATAFRVGGVSSGSSADMVVRASCEDLFVKVLVPLPDTDFDICGKKGIADVKAANADGNFVGSMAQNYAQPPAIAGAYHDVVTKFFHGEIKTSDDAVKELLAAA